jgi:outer membrane protein
MKKLLLACVFVFSSFSLASADLKVAVVDLNKAFDSFYETKDAQAKLKEKQDGYQKEIQGYINDYQQMGEEADSLNKEATDPTLSAAARQDKATALQQKKEDLVNLGQKIQEMKVERTREIQEELLRRHKEIVDTISKVINDYSGPQGYDLVMDKSSASAASGVSIVLYSSPKLVDITTDIITLLNKNAPPGSDTTGAASTPTATAAPSPKAACAYGTFPRRTRRRHGHGRWSRAIRRRHQRSPLRPARPDLLSRQRQIREGCPGQPRRRHPRQRQGRPAILLYPHRGRVAQRRVR